MSKDIVTGKSVEDILNMDVSKLTESELRKITGRLVSAGNKRVRRMVAEDEKSPALIALQKSGGMLSTKGKNLNQLRSEFKRAKQFLQSQTSSLRGFRKVKRDTIKALKGKDIILTDDQWDVFWRSFEELKEIDKSVATQDLKYGTLDAISKIVKADKDADVDDVVFSILGDIKKIYEERAKLHDSTSVSGYFEM